MRLTTPFVSDRGCRLNISSDLVGLDMRLVRRSTRGVKPALLVVGRRRALVSGTRQVVNLATWRMRGRYVRLELAYCVVRLGRSS